MINFKQLQRMAAKVSRLREIYEPYLILSRQEIPVCISANGTEKPVFSGDNWGADFACADFVFRMPSLPEGAVYLEADTGGVENLIEINGMPYGLTDWVRGAREPEFRIHRYVLLEGVHAGASVRVQAYASHTIAGTQPLDAPHTFSLRTVEMPRTFRGIYLVTFRADVKLFLENLRMFESIFRAAPGEDWLKQDQYEVYEELYRICSALSAEPEALSAANECFNRFFRTLPQGREKPFLGLIGHSHLDTAWLWTVEETRRKAVRTAANAVTLLKRHKDYRFFMSTALYLDWFRKDEPGLFSEIQKLVKEGRFEPNGAVWVECDCNLTGAEALVRQFLRGKLFLREYLGYESDTFWLPDTFGYSAALPQIMRRCGVKYFLTTKLSWNDTNEFPYESFLWKGIDGSGVLVHFNTIHSEADPEFLMRRMRGCKNKHLDDNMLVAYGYGDGGGGPSEEMVSRALETQKIFPWGKAEHISVSDFMKRLEGKELPKYCGELYLELHRGTLTSNHAIKRNNRVLETALHNAEYFSAALGMRDWKRLTDENYDVLMLNQFHDILPGSSISEVNAQSLRETSEAILRLNELVRGEGEGAYYNTLSFPREEILECADGAEYTDFNGVRHSLARFAFPAYGKGERMATDGKIEYRNGVVTTPYLRAKVEGGGITSLVFGGREFAEGILGEIRAFESFPYQWDNWDIDADYPLKQEPVRLLSSEAIHVGTLQLRIRNTYALCKESMLVVDIVFNACDPQVTFECKLDFREDHSLVRVYFPTNLLAPTVKSQTQFGFIDRSVYRNTSETQAQFEVCNHKWSDLSETNFGLALINNCKYGFSCEEGTMSLTLAKGGAHPDPNGDKGVQYFSFALVPHTGAFSARDVLRPAERFNLAPVLSAYAPFSPIREISAEGIVCETVKLAERGEGIVLRLYESERSRTETEIRLSKKYRIAECNLLEDKERDLGETDCLRLTFKPFEIKTLLLS